MPFNINKRHILQVGVETKYLTMNGTKLKSAQMHKKNPGVTITSSLKFFKQYKDAAGDTDRMLDFMNRNFSFKNKDIILPMYISLVRHPPRIHHAILFVSH